MTRIKIAVTGGTFELDVSGHSGFAAKGSDICCAGISTIACTVLNYCLEIPRKLKKPLQYEINADAGMIYVSVSPKAEHTDEIRHVFRIARLGFEGLQKEFPDNISFIIVDNGLKAD